MPPPRQRRAQTGLYVKSASGLKLRDRKVQKLVRVMRVAMPWLEEADIPACRAWAQLEILADIAYAMLQRLSIVSDKYEPRRLLTDYRQLRQTQLSYARDLGMTPAARMAIKASGTKATLDLPAQMARRDDEEIVPDDDADERPAGISSSPNPKTGL